MNLKECFSKVRNGDKEAFALVYSELKQPVLTIACRILRSKEAAEDITQEVFVRLFISPPDSSVSNPRAWIFQMVHNLAVDALRKKQCDSIEAVTVSQEDTSQTVLLRMDIEKAMSMPSLEEREILSLHLNGGLKFNEIAKITGLSMSAVYRRYRKALKTLRDLLNGGTL